MLNSLLTSKLEDIYKTIISKERNNNYGLIGGNMGEILFLFYYSKLADDTQINTAAFNRLEKTINEVNKTDNLLFSFSNGLSGFLWSLHHLKKHSYILFDESYFNIYDPFILKLMREFLKNGLYDYLHKSLGILLFYLNKEEYKNDIINSIEILKSNKIDCEKKMGVAWKYYLKSADSMVINLGLSHGLASIIAILSKLYKKNHNYMVKELIEDSIRCLLFSKKNDQSSSLFPNHIYKNGKSISNKAKYSRLAWCYGDLGISVAIWHASQALERKDWEEEAINILLHSAKRRNLKENGVVDAGLCHGTAGIAHIFNRMYGYTGIEALKDASEYWFDQTLKMARFEDGLAGYKAWQGNERGWVNEPGLLEGIAGIGLAMISAVSDIEPAWDECLLLS